MKVGTKSVLIGAHQFLIHPLFVGAAWTRLYGFPKDVRLWAAFFLHDLGYVGKSSMDSEEGERHVELGAKLMAHWFDGAHPQGGCVALLDSGGTALVKLGSTDVKAFQSMGPVHGLTFLSEWGQFSLLHSRFYAKRLGLNPSQLCPADKLSVALEPWWLYLPRVIASGEVWEYLALATQASKYSGEPHVGHTLIDIQPHEIEARKLTPRTWLAMRQWHDRMCRYLTAWAAEHADGRADTWTPEVQA